MNGWVDDNGWIHCPVCGNKTRIKVKADTVLKRFPLFCPKCRQETIIDLEKLRVSSSEIYPVTQRMKYF